MSRTLTCLLVCSAACAGPRSEPTQLASPSSARGADEEPARAEFEPLGEVTLSAALAAALARRPELLAIGHEHLARLAEVRQAERRPNPRLGLDVEDFAGSEALSGFDQAQTTLWVQQPVEMGGKQATRTRVAQLQADATQLEVTLLAIEVAAQTRMAYWGALAAQEELELARSMEETARRFHEVVVERVAAGRASPVEEAKYAVALASARLNRQEAERSLSAARRGLARTWGGKVGFTTVVGEFGPVVPPTSLEDLEERLSASSRLRLLELDQEAGIASLEAAQSSVRSNWNVRLGVRRFEDTDSTAAVFSLDIPLQIFNTRKDAVSAARERAQRGTHDRAAAELELLGQLARTWARLADAYEEIIALDGSMLDDARRVFEAVDEGYREGKFELLDVLDAQRTFFELRARHVRALERYHLARTEIDFLIGGTS